MTNATSNQGKHIYPMLLVLTCLTTIDVTICSLLRDLTNPAERIPVLVVILLIPVSVVATFLYLWVKKPGHLYPPSELGSGTGAGKKMRIFFTVGGLLLLVSVSTAGVYNFTNVPPTDRYTEQITDILGNMQDSKTRVFSLKQKLLDQTAELASHAADMQKEIDALHELQTKITERLGELAKADNSIGESLISLERKLHSVGTAQEKP